MKYLYDFYSFNPEIINTDYSKALINGIKKRNIFDNAPIIINCFFHFSQALTRKMKSLNFSKTYNNSLYMLKKIYK